MKERLTKKQRMVLEAIHEHGQLYLSGGSRSLHLGEVLQGNPDAGLKKGMIVARGPRTYIDILSLRGLIKPVNSALSRRYRHGFYKLSLKGKEAIGAT